MQIYFAAERCHSFGAFCAMNQALAEWEMSQDFSIEKLS